MTRVLARNAASMRVDAYRRWEGMLEHADFVSCRAFEPSGVALRVGNAPLRSVASKA